MRRPRFNWLALSVRRQNDTRFLDVEVYPRIWNDEQAKFDVDRGICGAEDHRLYSVQLEEWTESITPPSRPSSAASTIGHDEEAGNSIPAESANSEKTMNAIDAARTLTYRFLDLPHVTRIFLAQSLGLYKNEDEGLQDSVLFDKIFERAVKEGKLNSCGSRLRQDTVTTRIP
jgi:hypothetical protein